MQNTKAKKVLKANRENRHISYNGNTIKQAADFSTATAETRSQ